MRQKTINFVFDKIMWYILYFMPIILMLILGINNTGIGLAEVFDIIGINIDTTNVLYSTLIDVFGTSGVFPMFIDTNIFIYLTYFVDCYLLHFMLDLFLFIPKIARKWVDSVVGGIE